MNRLTNVYIHDIPVAEERRVRQRFLMSGAKSALSVRFVDDMHEAGIWIFSEASVMLNVARRQGSERGVTILLRRDGDDSLYRDGDENALSAIHIANLIDGIQAQDNDKVVAIRPEKHIPSDANSLKSLAEQIRHGMTHRSGTLVIRGTSMLFSFDFASGKVRCNAAGQELLKGEAWTQTGFDGFVIANKAEEGNLVHAEPAAVVIWKISKHMVPDAQYIPPLYEKTALSLTRWPDFDQLPHEYDDYRMASLLQKRSLNLENLVKLLKVEEYTAKSFFNAAYLCGYADIDAAATPVVIKEPPKVQTGLAGLWRKVRIGWGW